MRGNSQVIAQIFDTIERLKQELASLRELIQQAVFEESIQGDIFVGTSFVQETESDLLVDAQIIEDTKPPAKQNKREWIAEARRQAQEWARAEQERNDQKREREQGI